MPSAQRMSVRVVDPFGLEQAESEPDPIPHTRVCPNASGTCTASACVLSCEGRFLDCDGEPLTGCEADPMSDPRNCGACGNDCGPVDGGSSLCVDGACALSCDPGFGD